MENNDKISHVDLLSLTTDIVSAHVSNNIVPVADIPELIKKVYGTLGTVGKDSMLGKDRPQPAVPVRKSIMPDYIVCLEDGKKLKMLKRHLKTSYDMSPADYREKWGLPADYPMVAPNYAKQRSELAKEIGLGTNKPHDEDDVQ